VAWTEQTVAAQLARHIFNRKCLVVVPNCMWTGHECDLFAVTQNLRIIDVEIKISRADLKADAAKDKWFHAWDWKIDGPFPEQGQKRNCRPRQWPRKVWKHYYCLPEKVWTPELLDSIQPVSGVLLIREIRHDGFYIRCERRAKPCRDAEKLDAEDAIDIARLAGLRMWDAFDKLRPATAQNSV
jgi:hypothetical protein